MKAKLFLTSILSVLFVSSYGQIEVNSSGNVGIGVTPGETYKLDVTGETRFGTDNMVFRLEDNRILFYDYDGDEGIVYDAYDDEGAFFPDDTYSGLCGTSARNFYKGYFRYLNYYYLINLSDSRLKENIRSLTSPLEKLRNIRGVQFDYITPTNSKWKEEKINELEYMDNNNIGFIAQELMEVYPELVKYDKNSDLYGINYQGIIPILVEAIKEQQTLIDEIQAEVIQLKSNNNLKSAPIEDPIGEILESSTLFQNSPNPFNESTEIDYYISEDIQYAYINIYDLSGTQLKSVELHFKENGSITINGGEFRAGIYLYNLITDGKVVDSKQMILTD